MADILALIIASFRLMTGLALLLFVPGFAIMLVFYPKHGDIPLFERVALSGILSIGSAVGVFLFLDLVLGIDTTAGNGFLSLSVITVLALVIWRTEIFFTGWREKRGSLLNTQAALVRSGSSRNGMVKIYRRLGKIFAVFGKNRQN